MKRQIPISILIICGLTILLTGFATPAPSDTIYVDVDNAGDPQEDGTTVLPFDTIQEGIDAAMAGDTVLVADGTYTGAGNRDLDFQGKAITVRSEYGPALCIIDCQGSVAESHRGFNFHSGEGDLSVVQGFTIQNGYAYNDTDSRGGGILCLNASPTITGNTVTGCDSGERGGGICCWQASPVIVNNTITGNIAVFGGGVYCGDSSAPTITGNTITDNDAEFGGGIHSDDSNPLISGNSITVNRSFSGGGIYCDTCSPEITFNRISENTVYSPAGSGGGGIYCWDASPTITNNLIVSNIASNGSGAGLSCQAASSPVLTNNTVAHNYATQEGGGLFSTGSYVTVINSIFFDNTADVNGAEMAIGNWVDISTLDISYTFVYGGQSGIHTDPGWWVVTWGSGMISGDPLFINCLPGDYCLSCMGAGQTGTSPCINAGSAPATDICFNTAGGIVCMDQTSTRCDRIMDSLTVDMGCHYADGLFNTIGAQLTCQPASGTLPFSTLMTVTMANNYTGQTRRVAGRLDAHLANGQSFPNWKTGFTNIGAGGSFTTSWNQDVPALGSMLGDNVFHLVAEDVTPSPYNAPPHPASGDTDSDTCTLTGVAP